MGPRIYPSQQDTNLTAKGSLILSSLITDNLEIYVNNTIVNKQFSIIDGLYIYLLNIGDSVTLTNTSNLSFNIIRKEYTTDDVNGNNGIVSTFITGVTNQSSITFTITTTPLSYNFEYLINISSPITPTPTPPPTKNMTFTCQYDQNVTPYFGSSATFLKSFIGSIGVRKSPSNSFLSPLIPTGDIIFGTGFTSTGVINTIPNNFDISLIDPTTEVVNPFQQCYTGLSSNSYVDYVSHKTEVYIDNVLVDTNIYPLVFSDMVTCGTPHDFYSYFSNLFNNQFGNAMFVKFTDNIEIAGPITAAFAPESSGSTYTCYSAPTYTFAAKSEDLSLVNYIKGSVINTLPLNGIFWLSKNGKVRKYKRIGGEDYATPLELALICTTPTPLPPTSTPTPSPTATNTPTPAPPTPTPTITPTPTATNTPTPTPTPPPTGYTGGYYILVNDSFTSYPGTGTTWFSLASGTTYNGTLTNGPVWSGGTPGFFTFDGTNDWVDFGSASSGSTSASFTWGGWVKTTTSATQKVFMMRGNDASLNGWSLFLSKESDNKFQASVVTSTGGFFQTDVKSTTTMSNDTWYYIVGTWLPGVRIRIYINGVLENTTTTSRITLRGPSIGWNLMRNNDSTFSNGSLSEFIVYQSELSGTDILSNFNANKSKYGY